MEADQKRKAARAFARAALSSFAKEIETAGLSYLPVLTYCMQSPWFLKVLPSGRTLVVHPPFLHCAAVVGTLPPKQDEPGAGAISHGV